MKKAVANVCKMEINAVHGVFEGCASYGLQISSLQARAPCCLS
jgi:hypothetical protein